MKFTVDAKAFGAAMAIAGRVIPTKSPWPIMSNLHMAADGTTLRIRGTNADLTYEAEVAAQVEVPGETLVSHATLAKFFSAAKGDSLSVEVKDGKAAVKAGRARIVLAATDTADFPKIAPVAGDLVTVDGPAFVFSLRFCSAAAEDSEVKFNIAGVNISETDSGLEFWGTDGNSAHHAIMAGVPSIGGGGTLPLDAIAVITGLADKADIVSFIICETGWHAIVGPVHAWGKVIDGKFPDVRRALSAFTGWQDVAHTGSADLSSAVEIASVGTDMNSDKTRNIVMRSDGSEFIIRGHKTGVGTIVAGRAVLDCEAVNPIAMVLNSDYIRAALTGIGAGEITIMACDQALKIIPRQINSALTTEVTMMQMRVAPGDVLDV